MANSAEEGVSFTLEKRYTKVRFSMRRGMVLDEKNINPAIYFKASGLIM